MGRKGQFKKGQSGNPSGRPKLTAEQRALRNMTRETIGELTRMLLSDDLAGIKAMAETPRCPAIKLILAKAVFNAVKKGDLHALNLILDRAIGKVAEHVDVGGTGKIEVAIVNYAKKKNASKA